MSSVLSIKINCLLCGFFYIFKIRKVYEKGEILTFSTIIPEALKFFIYTRLFIILSKNLRLTYFSKSPSRRQAAKLLLYVEFAEKVFFVKYFHDLLLKYIFARYNFYFFCYNIIGIIY